MDEVLTMEEIYAQDWVLIAEPETDEMHRVLRGKVVFHGSDGDECWYKAIELNLPRAVRYLGEYPEHLSVPPEEGTDRHRCPSYRTK